MELRLPKSIESVVVVESDNTGRVTPLTRFKKKKKKKRRSTIGIREAELLVRRLAEAQQAFINSYVGRHNNSHRKKRDGWLMDSPRNIMRATEKGLKKLV